MCCKEPAARRVLGSGSKIGEAGLVLEMEFVGFTDSMVQRESLLV